MMLRQKSKKDIIALILRDCIKHSSQRSFNQPYCHDIAKETFDSSYETMERAIQSIKYDFDVFISEFDAIKVYDKIYKPLDAEHKQGKRKIDFPEIGARLYIELVKQIKDAKAFTDKMNNKF